jgi:hypothetical protein
VRTTDDKDVARLKAAGATEVIPEVLESSLLIAAETLVQAGIPMEHAIQHVREVRAGALCLAARVLPAGRRNSRPALPLCPLKRALSGALHDARH